MIIRELQGNFQYNYMYLLYKYILICAVKIYMYRDLFLVILLVEASRGVGTQSMNINATSCGFDPTSLEIKN